MVHGLGFEALGVLGFDVHGLMPTDDLGVSRVAMGDLVGSRIVCFKLTSSACLQAQNQRLGFTGRGFRSPSRPVCHCNISV